MLPKSLQKKTPLLVRTLKKHGVVKAGIFGSYASGNHKKGSDIDILIKPKKGMGLEFVGLALELEEKLGKKVDLITYRSLHPYLKKSILSGEVRIL